APPPRRHSAPDALPAPLYVRSAPASPLHRPLLTLEEEPASPPPTSSSDADADADPSSPPPPPFSPPPAFDQTAHALLPQHLPPLQFSPSLGPSPTPSLSLSPAPTPAPAPDAGATHQRQKLQHICTLGKKYVSLLRCLSTAAHQSFLLRKNPEGAADPAKAGIDHKRAKQKVIAYKNGH
ncbi:Protein of unknown function, partial [Gryllus bimaculatus]